MKRVSLLVLEGALHGKDEARQVKLATRKSIDTL